MINDQNYYEWMPDELFQVVHNKLKLLFSFLQVLYL